MPFLRRMFRAGSDSLRLGRPVSHNLCPSTVAMVPWPARARFSNQWPSRTKVASTVEASFLLPSVDHQHGHLRTQDELVADAAQEEFGHPATPPPADNDDVSLLPLGDPDYCWSRSPIWHQCTKWESGPSQRFAPYVLELSPHRSTPSIVKPFPEHLFLGVVRRDVERVDGGDVRAHILRDGDRPLESCIRSWIRRSRQ